MNFGVASERSIIFDEISENEEFQVETAFPIGLVKKYK